MIPFRWVRDGLSFQGGGGANGGAAALPLVLRLKFLIFRMWQKVLPIQKYFCRITFRTSVLLNPTPRLRGEASMNNVEELIDFIKNLTPEQAEKIIRQMPELISSTEAPCQPVHPKAS